MQINTKIEKDDIWVNEIANKIANILGEDKKKLGEKFKKEGIKKSIDSILKNSSNQKNKKLAMYLIWEVDSDFFQKFTNLRNDKDVCTLAIKKSSNNFYYINNVKLKKDVKTAVWVVNSMIRESKSFLEVRDFIVEYFPESQKKLFDVYEKNLEKYNKIIWNDLDKIIFSLSKEKKEFIDLLKKKKIIKVSLKTTKINEKFIDNFIKSLSEEIKNNENIENIEEFKKNKLIKLLWINNEYIDENIEYLIELILKLVNLDEQKNIVKEEKEDNDEVQDVKDVKKDEYKDEDNDDFDDLMEMEFSWYSYLSNWDYISISTNEDISIKISNSDKDKFTSKALENYITFYKLFYKLWLKIFLEKYNLKSLLAYKEINFDYTYWVWITKSKTLKILNLIGKNIWIPEVEVLVNWEEKPKKEVRCFKTFEDAKNRFEDIKSSSIINWEYIETNSNIWIFEKKLVLEWKLDYDKGSINLSKWS